MLYDCIVIGAGAAGLFYAATRSGKGPVLLADRQDRPGRKILLSGGGKCNVTNLSVGPENYLGREPLFTRQALAAFRPEGMLSFLNNHHIPLEEREHGQIFCRQSSENLRDLLFSLAKKNGAEFALGQRLISATSLAESVGNDHMGDVSLTADCERIEQAGGRKNGARFAVTLESGRYLARNLLVACGGPSWPKSGASHLGKKIAQDFGHGYIAPRPALTPLKMERGWPLQGLQGISVKVTASASGGPVFTLPLLFTHEGISGPACLQASSYLEEGGVIRLDFLPDADFKAVLDDSINGKLTPFGLLRRLLPERLAAALLSTPECLPFKDRKCAELSRAARTALINAVHQHEAVPQTPNFNLAESSTGGIATNEVNPKTMESRLVPGLFFAGEVLDVCGQLGGYNLHWAWASASVAGRKI